MSYRSEEEPLDTHLWFLWQAPYPVGARSEVPATIYHRSMFCEDPSSNEEPAYSKPYHNSLKNVKSSPSSRGPRDTEATRGTK